MTTPNLTVCQRWNQGRDSYRPAGETIATRLYEVADVSESQARAFVARHHYSHSYPAARFRHGLYGPGGLVGVAVFSVPMNNAVLTNWLPGEVDDNTELGRFILLDEVPANGETWFLARCFEMLRREGIGGVLSFSDPVPRIVGDRQLFPGHLGVIYQAHNGVWRGRSKAQHLRLFADGTVFSERSRSKIVSRINGGTPAQARGWEACVKDLVERGAPQPQALDHDWLAAAEAKLVVSRIRHPGNHRYLWGLNRHTTKAIGRANPAEYPKQLDKAA